MISTAHEWVQKNGDAKRVICTRCLVEAQIGKWHITPRCLPHHESEKSGYLPEVKH
jgi:hypothetical protein